MEISFQQINMHKSKQNFSGLTRVMSKSVYNSQSFIDNANLAYPKAKGFVGTFPKEMLNPIIKSCSKDEVKPKIEKLKSTLVDITNELRNSHENTLVEKAKTNIINNIDNVLYHQLEGNNIVVKMLAREYLVDGSKSYFKNNQEAVLSNIVKKYSPEFKKSGILPNDGTLQMEYLGEGMYGNAYKLSFLDKDSKKVFHDKVLKVYKSDNVINNPLTFVAEQIIDSVKSMSKEEYSNSIRKIHNRYVAYSNPLSDAEIEKNYDFIISAKVNDLNFNFLQHYSPLSTDDNGVGAEANAALYIKKAIGHPLSNTDFITPYIFNLNSGFALIDMADSELKINKKIRLEPIGITSYDLHIRNIINDKIIDYGGVSVINKTIVTDKIKRRESKHKSLMSIKDSIREFYELYKKNLINNGNNGNSIFK